MRNILNLTLFLLFALARVGGLWSQTLVTNDITANTDWTLSGSPFLIANDIRIDAGILLSIEAGVEVRVSPSVKMQVEGRLEAFGLESDSIVFHADVASSPWGGISIGADMGSQVLLRHCEISEGNISGINAVGDDHLEVSNCTFRNCSVALVDLNGQQTPVTATTFDGNMVAVENGDLNFSDCNFNKNGTGIRNSEVSLFNSTFNKSLLVAMENCSGTIENCDFFYNTAAIKSFGTTVQDSVLDCSFGLNDTALVVSNLGTSYLKNEFCGNDWAVVVTTASDIDLAGNCWCTVDPNTIDQMIWDGNDQQGFGKVNYLPLNACNYPGIVWPGDADNDGVANILDVLNIGVAFGSQGGGRPNATQVWAPQTGVPWGLVFDNGTDFVHADCNGNGVVDLGDVQPVIANFGETHQKTTALSASGVPLCLVYPDSAGPGDTIMVEIYLGDSLLPATDLHGFAITLGYDRGVIDSATISTAVRSSYLGTNLLDVSYSENSFHWAISRTDQQDTLTYGRLGGVGMIMIDDLARTVPIVITVEEAIVMDETGKTSSVSLGSCGTAARIGNGLSVFPNPARERMTIGWEAYEVESLDIYGPSGQLKVHCEGMDGQQMDIDTEGFTNGIYIVRARLKNGLLTRKITILR